MATKTFKLGDRASWNSLQGKVTGSVNKKPVSPIDIKTHRVAASPGDPLWLVKNDVTGQMATHEPAALNREGQVNTENAHKVI